jgi:4-hydroxythreonine-4-phosphate dehydrogenase
MHASPSNKPLLLLTMGDVNGIGPEILLKALAAPALWEACRPVVLGCAKAYENARHFAPEAPRTIAVASCEVVVSREAGVAVCDGGWPAPAVRHGVLDPEAGQAAIEWVKLAAGWCLEGRAAGMVTCPINKEAVQKAGYQCSGHTDLIADMCGKSDYRMCLFTETMRVVHITGHLSLYDALKEVKCDRILESIRVGHDALTRMGLAAPRIAVAGLNPHAGEAGAFGREEIDEVAPAIVQGRTEGIECSGPYPPDTVFRRMREGEFDMVIALYHDQGHIPMKLIAMDEGVNVTLGIPIVRTSVDHGTAFDIAGRGIAREDSLIAAVRLAAQLSASKVAL